MILDRDQTFSYFSFYSDLEGAAAEKYRLLSDLAAGHIQSRIKPELLEDPEQLTEEDRNLLCMVAAAYAYQDWLELSGGGTFAGEEIKVGDITLKNSSGTAVSGNGDDVRQAIESKAAHLLEPPFVFGRTPHEQP